jgi:hypothetical protein
LGGAQLRVNPDVSLPVAVLVVVLVGGEGAVVGAVPLVVGPMPIDVVVAVALPVAVSGGVDPSVGTASVMQVHSDGQSTSLAHEVAARIHQPGKEVVVVQVVVSVAVSVSMLKRRAPVEAEQMPWSFGEQRKPSPQSASIVQGRVQG